MLNSLPSTELARCRIKHPVGLQPVQDVVVAGEEDGLTGAAPPALGEGPGTDPGNLPVNDGGELVDNYPVRPLRQYLREVGAELLPVREHVIGA